MGQKCYECPNTLAVALDNQAVAIVLNFVDPLGAVRKFRAAGGNAGLERGFGHGAKIGDGSKMRIGWVRGPSRPDTLHRLLTAMRDQMKRREFIAATAALLVSPRRSWAQGTRRRLGVLVLGERVTTMNKALLDGLRNHGWIDGRNLTIEYRYAQSQDRLSASAAELVALSPDLLIAGNPQTAVALKSATASIPIVFVAVADPVGLGLVQSLARPGGNITGLATFVPGSSSANI